MKDNSQTTVIVGISGGVDSSVAALLLKEQGYHVIGLFMRNWDEEDGQGACKAEEDYSDASEVCHQLGIDHYTVDFTSEYRERVFEGFVADLKRGVTPNPDILCNSEIKFDVFLDKALELGADFLATGHYCRTEVRGGKSCLLRGCDSNKDQSYFLHAVSHEKLAKALFPVGHLPKPEVRALAEKNGLVTASKRDSTGICFIGKRNFKEFISQYIPTEKGDLVTPEGQIVGQHDGIAFYTIGQRKGLGIGGEGDAWFVVDKDIAKNHVVVVQGGEHPALYGKELEATDISWVAGEPPELPYRCSAKVRYRQADVPCVIESYEDGVLRVVFDEPVKAITPHQSVVLYDGELCLGGGIIQRAL